MPAAGPANSNAAHSETVFHLQQAFKLALSMVLFYGLALWMNWDVPKYGGLAIVIISLGTSGASIEKGLMRVAGTTVGVAVGFLILSLFGHDRWATLVAFTVYLTVMCYFMQTSRYPYAWYAGAFVAIVVWGDNYPHFDSAFYFGTFRYLNTVVGVIIYTMVDLIFWPRHAGDQFDHLGRNLCAELRAQFRNYRVALERGQRPEGTSDLRPQLAGTLSRAIATLQQAYLDTPAVITQKRAWEVWRVNVRAFFDALELWRESIDDCRELDLDRLLPQLGAALDIVDQRLQRISALWAAQSEADVADTDNSPLMEGLSLQVDRSACDNLSHFERAAFLSFRGHLEILDRASRELLRIMRTVAGMESSRALRVPAHQRDIFRPARWDPARLLDALYPPAVLIAAFYFWILMNPPAGPKVPMFAAILAVMVLLSRMNPLASWFAMLLALLLAVAPVYWLIMPALSTGVELLSLIFAFSFFFGYLGGRSPALKSGPMLMFVVATGISNQQKYSFQGLVDAALMILVAGAILTAVYYLFNPLRPEHNLLRSLRRFFRGCARITSEFAPLRPAMRDDGQRLRKRYFESMVLPAPAAIEAAQKHLDCALYPDNTPEKVQRLHDSVQSIAYRLQSVEIAHERIARRALELPESLVPLRSQVRDAVQRVFEQWAGFEPGNVFEQQSGSLWHLSRDLQQQLDSVTTGRDQDAISDRALTDLYTLLGSMRGLINAMSTTQAAINEINWQAWAAGYF